MATATPNLTQPAALPALPALTPRKQVIEITRGRTYFNIPAGADLAHIAAERAPVSHAHECPDCRGVWFHEEYFCRNMNVPTHSVSCERDLIPAVPFLCDPCLAKRGVR